jgi:hypothetical protein
MSRIAFPYPTLFPHVSHQGAWEASIDGNQRLFREGSGSWDYDSGLEVFCRLPWTPDTLFEQAELSPLLDGARLAVVVSTGSSEGTGRRFVATDLAVRDCKKNDEGEGITLHISLDSACLCNRIKASLYIYSSGGEIGGIQLLSGSILYREDATLQLEGDLGSFPIRSLAFSSHNLGDGLWLVDCQADSPEDPLISSVTLLLNSDRPAFIEQLQSESEQTGFLRWAVRADVVSTALSCLLLNEELSFGVNQEWPDGSLGAIAIGWLRSIGVESQATLQQLAEQMKREPGRFRQRCQSACVLSAEDSP